ncbi:fatty acid desaturase [Nostocoides sp. HKS02]|uniref:acyl-CoA desaturase n=1 Tax=Nostocoides sp. HKS02 TaxID=1813880 RepID=UPI0012B46027|nr:fatty acid desaturase [Tetrasphaera sp. HKS02]QGN59128.1 acyl-CoA desaturase [Tetrasphaera sp. HKS02]
MTTATPTARTTSSAPPTADQDEAVAPERKHGGEQVALALFIAIPFLALLAAAPVAWGWGLGWHDIVIALVMYAVAGHGITVGFHRHFTHGSFKARRGLKIALAVAGSLAIEGPVVRWVADHRRHHAFSDREGDPHSPWRYGETIPALAKGLWWAHTGWLFDVEQTPRSKYAPDLMADQDLQRVDRAFPTLVAVSMLLPPVVGGLWSMSWAGALTAFFWGSLVRVALLHHVTWSINSICHAMGERPFKSRDRSGNVWWLAVLSMGESWHNLHHADPTCARHGVEKGQVDSSARVIWAFEKLGWARDVRWPSAKRLDARRVAA